MLTICFDLLAVFLRVSFLADHTVMNKERTKAERGRRFYYNPHPPDLNVVEIIT